jgi:hypothetical protein
MPHLVIPSITYYSPADEAAFFGWLESISGVVRVAGSGKELIVTLRSQNLSRPALREMIALHHRYGLPMAVLRKFETPQNASWFRAPQTYWHASVFGK